MDLYGPGGSNLQGLGALAEDETKAARVAASNREPEKGRWPSTRAVVISLGAVTMVVVVLGWILTALNR